MIKKLTDFIDWANYNSPLAAMATIGIGIIAALFIVMGYIFLVIGSPFTTKIVLLAIPIFFVLRFIKQQYKAYLLDEAEKARKDAEYQKQMEERHARWSKEDAEMRRREIERRANSGYRNQKSSDVYGENKADNDKKEAELRAKYGPKED